MKMQPVKSSKIDLVGYEIATHTLRVAFKDEKPRDFCHVPEQTYTALLHARSKYRFFKRNIQNSYSC